MLDVATLRNRVIEYRLVRPEELADHPYQWRHHPARQRELLEVILAKLGIAGALLAYYSPRLEGRLTAVDGHLRKSLNPAIAWPTLITDLNDEEADYLLMTYDPVSALAESGRQELDTLFSLVNPSEAVVRALVEEQLAEGEPPVKEVSDAELLKRLRVTVAEPECLPSRGDLWRLSGRHWLLCVDVVREAKAWSRVLAEALGEDLLFCPYPGPFVPLTRVAEQRGVFMVQPDLFIAGHILEQYKRIHGEEAVRGPERVSDAA